jgi:peptide/nickel transport system substrate-binding protein
MWPTAAWFLPFVGVQGMIIPRHVFAEYNGPNAVDAPANLAPIGTGPFQFVELRNEDILIIGGSAVSTNKIIYEANPLFREPDKPFFGKVELQGGGDLNLAVEAAKEGLVDFAWTLRVSDDLLDDMESAGNSVVDVSPTAFVERIMINFADPNTETADGERANAAFSHPIFNDKLVRQAIAMAIDRAALAEGRGLGARFTTNIVTQPPSIDSPDTTYKYDLEEAARLLDEAGWLDSNGDGVREKDGVELRLLFQTSIEPFRQISQEQVKQDLESIGFEVELKTIDASIFFGPTENTTDTRRHFYADMEEFAFSNKSPDPTSYLAGWTCSEAAQKENGWALSNWARYCNPEFDALFEEALTEFDVERRNDLFIAMNDLLIEDAAVLPIAQLNFPQGVNRDLKGVDITPWDVEVWNIMDWYK